MNTVEVRHLRALVAVVEHGGFTNAANSLGLSQANVSRTIASLEAVLGARVLRRTTREVALSPVGARVIEHARRVVEETDALVRAVREATATLRVGYAWAELGRHTTTVQRQWRARHGGAELLFVHSNTPTAGLREGLCDVAVLRRPVDDDRFAAALVGVEQRFAAMASGHALARRRNVTLADFVGRTVAVDARTGTTTEQLWPADEAPAATRAVDGVEEWLTVIAAGQAVGMTSEATARQHPRPGVIYRPVRDAPPVAVQLAWWRDSPPPALPDLIELVCHAYG
ncbi:MAG TPA: LysR family transcriptional regulator [Mycobacteriales bacterium]|nr:LysR family transcriptional regulator [Mycobacteriales bacterium]